MEIANVFVLLCLTAEISVQANPEDGHDEEPNTGKGSAQLVKSEGRAQADPRAAFHNEYRKCKDSNVLCFGNEKRCGQTQSCKFLGSITRVEMGYHINLFANESSQNHYVAIGFSTEGKEMKNVVIIACQGDDANPPVHFGTYWATTKTPSAVFKVQENILVDNNRYFQQNEDTLGCQFILKSSFSVKHSGQPYLFQLDKKPYKILMAVGEFLDRTSEGLEIKLKHHNMVNRRLSKEAIHFGGSFSKSFRILPMKPSYLVMSLTFTYAIITNNFYF